jgi:hypothetical protein
MKMFLVALVGAVVSGTGIASDVKPLSAYYTDAMVKANSAKFVNVVFGAKKPTISDHMVYSGVGNETEWLTQLNHCLRATGIVVSARFAYAYRKSCESELLGDASKPSLYYSMLRDLLKISEIDVREDDVEIVSTDFDQGYFIVSVRIEGGQIALFHTREIDQEDLGLIRIDYIELNGVRHEIENAVGDIELVGW